MCKGPDMGVNLMVLEPRHGGHYGWNRMSEGKVEQFLGGWGAGGFWPLKDIGEDFSFYSESGEKLLESIRGFIFIEKRFTLTCRC